MLHLHLQREQDIYLKWQNKHKIPVQLQMEPWDDVCPHCGKEGYVKSCYLGLHPKIKNWFRSDGMWKRMLSHWEERELGRTSSCH